VQFVLVAPSARSVAVVGDFNGWSSTANPLSSASGNVWTVQLPLNPGRYNYVFVVDGTTLVPDPAAPPAPLDEFGQPSSVITVGSAEL
jgi:1,4-alpha-glucan branching enzyme